MLKSIQDYLRSLFNPQYRKSALVVAVIIGSLLFTINHGYAFIHRDMTQQRWISALLTYFVPYAVNIHGRWSNSRG